MQLKILFTMALTVLLSGLPAWAATHNYIYDQGGASKVQSGDNINGIDDNPSPHAVYGNGNVTIDISRADNVTVTVNAVDADGIRTNPSGYSDWVNSNVRITLGNGWTIITNGLSGDGLNVNGGVKATNLVKAGDNLTVITNYTGNIPIGKEGAHGVRANFNGNIIIGDGLKVTTNGDKSFGVYGAAGLGIGTKEGITITIGNNAQIQTLGTGSHAVSLTSAGGVITFGSTAQFTTTKDGAHGVNITAANSSVTLGEGGQIETQGAKSYGIYNNGSKAQVNLGGETQITTVGNESHGLYSYVASAAAANEINMGAQSSIITNGSGAHGVYMYGNGSQINLEQGAQITTNGANAHALYARGSNTYGNNGKINVGDAAQITANGENAYGAFTDWSTAAIEFKGGANITAQNTGSYALYAKAGKITSLLDGSGNVIGGGTFNIAGDMKTETNGLIDLWLTGGSVFTGKTEQNGGALNLKFNEALWNLTGDSVMNNLTLNNSTVRFDSAPAFVTLNLDSLQGSGGILELKTDIQMIQNDKVIIAGELSGDHYIKVQNNGAANTTGTEILTLVETQGGSGSFALNHPGVELGGFVYNLRQTDNNWELFAAPRPPGPGPYDPDPELSSSADAIINSYAAGYLLNYADMQNLFKRLGDLRNNPEKNKFGVWARGYGGRFNSSGSDFLRGFKMDYYAMQAGFDYKVMASERFGDIYVGPMFGYINGNTNHFAGSGTVDMKTAGAYATYIGNRGFYVDMLAKYGWMENGIDVYDTQGNKVIANDIKANSVNLSLEAGQRLFLTGEGPNRGFYVEPQAQISYTHTTGDSVKASNGLKVKLEDYDSVLGRIGTNVGYTTALSEDTAVNVYAKVNYVHEFDGDIKAKLNNAQIKESFKANWVTYGVGASLNINEKHSVYADFEAASGGQFQQPWSATVGYRFTF